MKTFEEFIESSYFSSVHLPFDRALYSLTSDLSRIAAVLAGAGIEFEIVGGVAVLAHILGRDRSRSFVTRDIDLLVRREDLDHLIAAAEAAGYQARKIAGESLLIRPGQAAAEAVRLVFAGERSKSAQPVEHPAVAPRQMQLFDLSIPVAPLSDLVRMKLSSFRAKDLVHLETLEEAGLITPSVESELPAVLLDRLRQARQQWLAEKPDVE